jgi:hypothetical protein
MSPRRRAIWLALLALGSAACGAVKVTPAGSGLKLPPRPRDCDIAFLSSAPPGHYDAIADLEAHVTSPPRGGALEVLRGKACEMGADAVIVTRNFVTNALGHVLVAGTAIKLGELPKPAPPNEEAPRPPPAGAADL